MTSRHLATLLLASLPLSLWGQDTALGLKGYGLLTMSDLRNTTSSTFGAGGGAFVEFPLEGLPFRFRPYVGAQVIPTGTTAGLPGTRTGVSSVDFLLDTLWFPGESEHGGPYLIGSVGGHMWKVGAQGATTSTLSVTRFALEGGMGYQISPRLGAEVKAFWSPIRPDLTATGITLGATWRF